MEVFGNSIKILFLIIGILFFTDSFSQKNYIPGEIIELGGEKLSGFIDYREWIKNPKKIFFKKNLTDESQTFTPLDIMGFNVADEIYLGAIVEVEISPFKTASLDFDSKLKMGIDTTFLQVMIHGAKTLYYNRDIRDKGHFYIKNGDLIELLVYKKYLKEHAGDGAATKNVITENKEYLGQLADYFDGCISIYAKINTTEYERNGLVKLFEAYFNCMKSEVIYEKKKKKRKTSPLSIGVVAGVSSTSLNFEAAIFPTVSFPELTQVKYAASQNIVLGMFANVMLGHTRDRLSFYNEIMFTSYDTEGEYYRLQDGDRYIVHNVNFAYSYLKLNTMIRFKQSFGKFDAFANLGISNALALSETNHEKVRSKLFGPETTTEGRAIDDAKKHELGIVGGLGIAFGKISLQGRFEKSNGMSGTHYESKSPAFLKSIVGRYFLLVGYSF